MVASASSQSLMFQPRPVILTDGGVRREPVRPADQRPPGFDDQFDYRTLLFDGFFSGADRITIVAPPTFNLTPLLERMDVIAMPSGQRCVFRIHQFDRH